MELRKIIEKMDHGKDMSDSKIIQTLIDYYITVSIERTKLTRNILKQEPFENYDFYLSFYKRQIIMLNKLRDHFAEKFEIIHDACTKENEEFFKISKELENKKWN